MLSKQKLIGYLNWLVDESDFNAEERKNNGLNADADIECLRVASMLIDMIKKGRFDE